MKDDKHPNKAKTKILLLFGAFGGPVFVLAFILEGAMRYGYDPLRHPVSSLSIGNSGWIQISIFILTGILLVAFSTGIRTLSGNSYIAPKSYIPISLTGIGLIGAGIFVTDPVYGYPATMPLALNQFTWHGHLHDLFSLLVFICLPVACFMFRKSFARAGNIPWARYSGFTGIAMLSLLILAGVGFNQVPWLVDIAGVSQRLSIISGWAWIFLLAIHLLKYTQ